MSPVMLCDPRQLTYVGDVTWVCECQSRDERPPWSWVYCPQCGTKLREQRRLYR